MINESYTVFVPISLMLNNFDALCTKFDFYPTSFWDLLFSVNV